MVKQYLFLFGLLAISLLPSPVESTESVTEFEIDESNNPTLENGTENLNKKKSYILLTKKEHYITKKQENAHIDQVKNHSQIHDTSIYTETDLEETSSQNDRKIDANDIKENAVNNFIETHDIGNNETEMSNIYTDSDLEETASKEQRKHDEKQDNDKKSSDSYLFRPHKREIADTEHEEGSGEGSGNEPLTNNTF